MNGTPIVQQLKESVDKRDYVKLKNFCTAKETVTKLKRQPTDGRKSLPAIHLTKD
jgi:hypothetical protein